MEQQTLETVDAFLTQIIDKHLAWKNRKNKRRNREKSEGDLEGEGGNDLEKAKL